MNYQATLEASRGKHGPYVVTWGKRVIMPYANSKGPDQTARALTWVFGSRLYISTLSVDLVCGHKRS